MEQERLKGHQSGVGNENDQVELEYTCYESCLLCCGTMSGCLKIWCPCIACCCNSPLYQLETSTAGILQTFGKFRKSLSPGLHVLNPMCDSVITVHLKTQIMQPDVQVVITRDNVSLRIATVVYYRTINPYKLIYKLGNNPAGIRSFISQIASSSLRTVIGQNNFQELIQDRMKVAESLQKLVASQVREWGLFVEYIFIKDIFLSDEVSKNLQAAAIQKRLSEANIISAEADVQSAKLLKETSQILNSSSAMQIRYLDAVGNIISSGGQKMLFMNLKNKE